ncbi:restriction endonuclease FokI C-terminal domain-containing protein [Desemzia sp. FAM 23991]|uniref:restriction endonuclease FokI C-terminal domain-containing protein n=1 Tax=Desemzia sp. FAM 23991 TaxID=3259521 RepID=UPI00388B8422
MKSRTYGWVQNPSDFNKLKLTVQIFDSSSNHYQSLKNDLVPNLIVYFNDIKDDLQYKLDNSITKFTYMDLVGTSKDKTGKSPKSRKNAEANALIQISLLPQNYKTTGKRFTDNWTSDGYLRWAVSLNFIQVDRETDTFTITELGLQFSRTKNESTEETSILQQVLLSYPPATRVLSILDKTDNFHNKYYIGDKLGFRGERGFTSYNEKIMTDWLSSSVNMKEFKKIKSDVEGTSDKYARMISGWLKKVGFVDNRGTSIRVNALGKNMSGFQEYRINGRGKFALRNAHREGSSKNLPIQKFIMWEFLATDESNRDYVRTRRSYILKILQRTSSFTDLLTELSKLGFDDDAAIIDNDINGLIQFGIRIDKSKDKVILKDIFNDFVIPDINVTQILKDQSKDKLKVEFLHKTNLPNKFIELLDIAFDPKRNRDFEIITAELFLTYYGLNSKHLGGARKPDGLAYTDKFGLMLDTKAYGNGYPKNIGEADKMIRYIEDNKKRDIQRNPNEWWEEFDTNIPNNQYYFIWISGRFINRFDEQLEYTASQTKVNGGSLNVEQLLLGADAVHKGVIDKNDIPKFINNKEIIFVEE